MFDANSNIIEYGNAMFAICIRIQNQIFFDIIRCYKDHHEERGINFSGNVERTYVSDLMQGKCEIPVFKTGACLFSLAWYLN